MLEIDASLRTGVDELARLSSSWQRPTLASVVEAWKRRIALLTAFGVEVGDIRLNLQLRRGIAYYSGFVFEIGARGSDATSQLCAGGRYNELVATLGGREDTPAVGFALGLERVLLALDRPQRGPVGPRVDVFVVAAGDVSDVGVIRVAAGLRAHGVAAMLLNGRRVRYALSRAAKYGVRYVAVAGAQEAEQGAITLRDLGAHREAIVSVAHAAQLICSQNELP
jgi:histidyl-tRNA synthetase